MSKKCRTGKRGFRSEQQAKDALTAISQDARGENDPDRRATPNRYYPCGHCHRWHLTSAPPVELPEAHYPRPHRHEPTELEQALEDVRELEGIVKACIADGCGSCMHSAAYGAYKIRHMGRELQPTTTEGE